MSIRTPKHGARGGSEWDHLTNPSPEPEISTRYRVRKVTSGRVSGEKWIVWDLQRKGRVTVHAHIGREGAQAAADDLNIGDMVRDHAEDPRPYAERRAEAEAIYRKARGDTGR